MIFAIRVFILISHIERLNEDLQAETALLCFSPGLQLTFGADINMNHIRVAADGTILDIILNRPLRVVDGNDDFFTA